MGSIHINHHSAKRNILILVLFSWLLSGCAIFIRPEQPVISTWETLSETQTIGQTFVAKYAGLNGVYFYLTPQKTGDGEIRLHLRSGPQSGDDLAISLNSVSVQGLKVSGYYGFLIPSQQNSNQEYYYAFLELTGSGEVQVAKAAGNAYLNGALYQNGTPADAQAAFQLRYSRRLAALGLGREAITWAGILAIGLFLFILPGWGLFGVLWPGWERLNWAEKLGLSAGLSLAIYPLLLLWTDLVGLHLGAVYAWIPPLTGLGLILWKNRKNFRTRKLARPHLSIFKGSENDLLPDLVFLALIGLLVFTRFWAIRSLDLPMWADSYQHTMITQLLVDHGGLFKSWLPYTDLTTFTYHFGFHSAVAVFDWITHLEMPKAMLWMGQLVNLLAVIAIYPLAIKVGRSRWAGVVAVLVAGLLSPMPMYYVNWGRFTQLAGQVILPAAVWLLWNILMPDPVSSLQNGPQRIRERIGKVILAWIVIGGLALTHYRVLILTLIFLAALWAIYARRGTIKQILIKTTLIGVGAGLLFLPWFIRVFGGRIISLFVHDMTTSAVQALRVDPQLDTTGNLSFYLPIFLWVLFIFIIAIGLWRREKGILLLSLWWFANILAANPYWFGLPGAKYIDSFTVFIATYIPAGIVIGTAAGWLGELRIPIRGSQFKNRIALPVGIAILIIGIGLWGTRQRMYDVQPATHVQATRPDILAAQWIKANTPPDTRLLVNSYPYYYGYIIIATDGGWWLPLLAGRAITAPPMSYGFESDPWAGYKEQVNTLTKEIQAKGIQNPEILAALKSRGISYVYLGQLQGYVNNPTGPLFTSDQLLADPNFSLVYHQDRVWVFEIKQ